MRRWLLTLALVLAPVCVSAQIIHGGQGASGGSFASPGAGIPVDTTGSSDWIARCLAAGTGVSIANACGAAGNITVSTDFSVVPSYSSGTDAVSATGSVGTFYFETDANRAFFYPSTDTEHQILSIAPGALAWGDVFFIDTNLVPKRLAAGTSGQFLKTNGAGADPAWATSSFDPSTQIDLYDEFMSGDVSTGEIGQLGWEFTALSVGTLAESAGVATNPGLILLQSHVSSDNSGVVLQMHTGSPSILANAMWAGKAWSIDGVIGLGFVGDITADAMWFGLSNDISGLLTTTSFIGWRRDTDIPDTAFVAVVCDSSTTGCQAAGDATNQESELSTITPVDGGYYRFRIDFDPVGGPAASKKLSMRVNNETAITFCSSGCTDTIAQFPTEDLAPIFGYVTRTTTGVRSYAIDYFHLTISNLVRY